MKIDAIITATLPLMLSETKYATFRESLGLSDSRQIRVSHHSLCLDLVFTEDANRLGKHVSKYACRSRESKVQIPALSSPVPCHPGSQRMLFDIWSHHR